MVGQIRPDRNGSVCWDRREDVFDSRQGADQTVDGCVTETQEPAEQALEQS